MSVRKWCKQGVVFATVAAGVLVGSALADSQARVVRLSDVQGDVQIDRPNSKGFEKAFLNMPVVQGSKLRTNNGGLAEVQFEDGSAIRLTPGTTVSFPQLFLNNGGGHVSTAALDSGTAYVNFRGSKNDELTVQFGPETAVLNRSAHMRVEMDNGQAVLAVFDGDVKVNGGSGQMQVGRKQTATFDLANQGHYELAKNLETDPYDTWDKQQTQYAQTYTTGGMSGYSPYGYGMADLNYYGNYYSLPGYGTVWQPYFTGAGWSPFNNGAWLYYPGYGYNFTSAYPWGWTPYHSGNWLYAPSYGWVWQPGSTWTGLGYVPTVSRPPSNFTPPKPPTVPGQTQIVGSFPNSQPGLNNRKLEIPANTAGLGIPRGSVRNLPTISEQVQKNGTASVKVHPGVAPVSVPRTTGLAGAPGSTSLARPTTSVNTRVASPVSSRPVSIPRPPAPHISSPHR